MVGIVGSGVVFSWAYSLLRDTGTVLLDVTPTSSDLPAEIRRAVESDGDGAVLGFIHWKDRKKRLPFTQKMLRPPGESLRLRLIELDEQLNDRFVQLFLSAYSPLVMAGLVALQGVRATAGVWIALGRPLSRHPFGRHTACGK